nr:RNA-binding domain-containing protein [Rhodoferax sp.]
MRLGEDSSRQFKADLRNAESLAAEMVAFSNSAGGTLYIGVADDGTTPGLSAADVGRVNSKEELRRFFQITDQFHADELPTKAGLDKLDKLRFRDFLRDTYKQALPESSAEQTQLLQNMNLATDDGHLNLAGVLMFAERPEWIVPQFVVKAIRYPGNQIHVSEYVDTEDFAGHLPNNLTVEKIRTGNSNIRNPILVSYVAKGLLPYHGLRAPALAQALNTSPKNIERWLKQLKAQGQVEFRGAPKTGGYHATVGKENTP